MRQAFRAAGGEALDRFVDFRFTIVTNRLEYERDELLRELPELLELLEETCVQVNAAVTERYFRHEDPVMWSRERGL